MGSFFEKKERKHVKKCNKTKVKMQSEAFYLQKKYIIKMSKIKQQFELFCLETSLTKNAWIPYNIITNENAYIFF